jgi:hypothetical protein
LITSQTERGLDEEEVSLSCWAPEQRESREIVDRADFLPFVLEIQILKGRIQCQPDTASGDD